MFSDFNELKIAGRLGRNPQVKIVSNGRVMATFSVANRHVEVDELYGIREETTWLNAIAWEDTAKLVQSTLKKGDHVTLTGRLSIRKVENKETGEVSYFTQIVVADFQKNDRGNDKRASGAGNGAVKGPHPSQKTIAGRFTNETVPDTGEKKA